ncbi:MAG TPA: hypothetical protein DCZ94_22310 [Lentisphaeria bacterium]|nr:MAG: hypothetical protein A2X48_13550 [Lentisphaerae bacterium GWF2_49_21]HBC89682.1 hypothetical protein [Lentisphaeria bacterium]
MELISAHDRGILRQRAQIQLDYANSPQNKIILKKWLAQAEGRRESPPIRLLFSNFTHEVVTPRLKCEGEQARRIEAVLLGRLVGRELFDDDTPIPPTFDMTWRTHVRPFGIEATITRAAGPNAQGFHIDPVISDLASELDKLRGGSFGVDREATICHRELLEDVLGDILPVHMVMGSLPGGITNPLVHLMGMEAYYMAMFDCPDAVHEAMEMATRIYEQYYDFLEKEQLLLPTNGLTPLAQESFAFTDELPGDRVTKTTECWGFLESQETTAVSADTFGEFVFPYQQRLVDRFGLLSYGCCERVDAIWTEYLSKWSKLRKLSVSPFNNEPLIGEFLRGRRIVYYCKPRAEFVTHAGPLNDEAITAYFKGVCEAASGCIFEIAQREVGTIFGDFERGRHYVRLAREAVDSYWRP